MKKCFTTRWSTRALVEQSMRVLLVVGFLACSAQALAGSGDSRFHPLFIPADKSRLLLKLPKIKLPEATPGRKVQPGGPDPSSSFDLIDLVEDDLLVTSLERVAGWNPHLIYQDSNDTALFYYIPRELRLAHDENGYQFKVQYNSTEGNDASVLVTLRLAAPYHPGDVKLLKKLINIYFRKYLGTSPGLSMKVRALPALGAEADLEAFTTSFGITTEQVYLDCASTLRQPCTLMLRMTPDQAEAFIAQLFDGELSSSLKLPLGEEAISIPLLLDFSRFSGEYFKELQQWRQGQKVDHLTNITDFPLTVESVSAFVEESDHIRLESKRLKKQVSFPPGGSRPFRLPTPKKIFSRRLIMAWIDAELEGSCEQCLKHIKEATMKGIGMSPLESATIEAMPDVFERFDLYKLLIEVRSPYFSTGGKRLKTRLFTLSGEEEGNIVKFGLFIPPNLPPERKLFEYRLRVVTREGEIADQKGWTPVDANALYLTQKHIAPLMDRIPHVQEHNESREMLPDSPGADGQDETIPVD